MKILKVIHGFPPLYNAGSEVYSHSLVEALSKEHKVHVFTREEDVFAPDFRFRTQKRAKYPVTYVNMARAKDGYNHPLINRKFARLLEDFKPDIVHIGHLNHLSTGIVDIIKEKNIPLVYTLHDYWLICPRGQFLQRNFDGENLYEVCESQDHFKCAATCYRMYFSGIDKRQENSLRFKTGQIPSYDMPEEIRHWTNWIETRQYVMKSLSEKVDMFIAPSRYLMHRYINDFGVPQDKIIYLDYGFPLHYLQPVNPEPKKAFTFGYIGRIIPAKGVHLLIKAFKKIKQPAVLKIWGIDDGQTLQSLKRLAENSRNPIHFEGEYINKHLADTVFSHIDALVVPSIWVENSPLVIHEAQACHIPVITADTGGMAEYVRHKENGLLFKFRDPESLLDQMIYAVNHPEEMKQMGRRGYLYSPDGSIPHIDDHAASIITLYYSLIKNKKNEGK